MSVLVLSILIFLVTVGLVISGFYFFIHAPAEKRRLRERIEIAKQEISASSSQSEETRLLRAEVLSNFLHIHRLCFEYPGINRLQYFVHRQPQILRWACATLLCF
jgi:hypothetical protein